ncbi:MAG: hypothetical protein OCU22_07675 [Canidatus Methanoxibalbensis ujae]|nr:hypothetical protein [Candidatus Methanoxibalbensis ujae]
MLITGKTGQFLTLEYADDVGIIMYITISTKKGEKDKITIMMRTISTIETEVIVAEKLIKEDDDEIVISVKNIRRLLRALKKFQNEDDVMRGYEIMRLILKGR